MICGMEGVFNDVNRRLLILDFISQKQLRAGLM